MVSFVPVPVTDPHARTLLENYFAYRSETFPAALGTYRAASPRVEDFVSPDGVFLLVMADAVDGDEPVDGDVKPIGCGGVRRISDAGSGARFEIKHLWIQPDGRRLGAGRSLLAELERRAIAFGAREIVLDTNASLSAAARLYAGGGYEAIPPYNDNPNATNWYGKRVDAGG